MANLQVLQRNATILRSNWRSGKLGHRGRSITEMYREKERQAVVRVGARQASSPLLTLEVLNKRCFRTLTEAP